MQTVLPLALSAADSATLSVAHEAKRDALLSAANWTRTMEFEVGMRELNSDMMTWLRLVFASAAELDVARTPLDFGSAAPPSPTRASKTHSDAGLSSVPRADRLATERSAVSAVLAAVGRELAHFEHSLEEDEVLLEAHAKALRGEASRTAVLPRRGVIAVRYRRLVKRALVTVRQRAHEHLHAWSGSAQPRVVAQAVHALGRQSAAADRAGSSEEREQAREHITAPKLRAKRRRKKAKKRKEGGASGD